MDQVLRAQHCLAVRWLVLVVLPLVTPAQVIRRGDLNVLLVWRWVWLCLVVKFDLTLRFSWQQQVSLGVTAYLRRGGVAFVWLDLGLRLAVNVRDVGYLGLLLVGNWWWLVVQALGWTNVYAVVCAWGIIISLISLMIQLLFHICIDKMQVINIINLNLRSKCRSIT